MATIDSDSDFSDPDDAPLPSPLPPSKRAATAPPPPPPHTQRLPHRSLPPYALASDFMPTISQPLPRLPKSTYGKWTTLYPLYIDAKRPSTPSGGRRVSRQLAVAWPLADKMAESVGSLGLECVLEPGRTHPKDWDNPGRVKVNLAGSSWTKRKLLVEVARSLGPLQPKTPAATATNARPLPPIEQRLPPNSPAISHGTLESALSGSGPFGALLGGAMGRGGAGAGDGDRVDDGPAAKAGGGAQQPKIIKPKKVHIKRR